MEMGCEDTELTTLRGGGFWCDDADNRATSHEVISKVTG